MWERRRGRAWMSAQSFQTACGGEDKLRAAFRGGFEAKVEDVQEQVAGGLPAEGLGGAHGALRGKLHVVTVEEDDQADGEFVVTRCRGADVGEEARQGVNVRPVVPDGVRG